jgi:amino acid adenylation domain-containing protein
MEFATASRANPTRDALELPSALTHAIVEAWVDWAPDSLAVTGEQDVLTYAQLEQRANQIAHALLAAGVQRGSVVAVCLERGPELIAALLGVLKSGAAFAAFDPRAPRELHARLFAAVECQFLITRRPFRSSLPAMPDRLLLLDDPACLRLQPVARPAPIAGSHDPACVLFTSGSTAHPKAVLYLHRNLAKRFSNAARITSFDHSSTFAQSSPITSIDSIDEIFLPLVTGGCTAILPYATVTDPHHLINTLCAQGVTHMLLVPSLLRVILAAEEDLSLKLAALRTWIVGGEPLSAALVDHFYRRLPRAALINFYGLTEGDASFHITSPEVQYQTSVPIGRPVQDTEVYLLDENLNRVAPGKLGEICLGGDALFHEYLNCPELNATRWIPNPFSADGAKARLFRTGDMGRLRSDGELEYAGRADRMAKVRGFRVDLGEVEAMLSQHAAVDQCIVVARQRLFDDALPPRLSTSVVAYAVLRRGASASAQELRAYLKNRLPEFAVPAMVLLLDSFPLSPNGKIDVPALPEPASPRQMSNKAHVPGRNPVEIRLVRIWEDLLNLHPISATDNFFELGGDSLVAIDLMLSIEKEFQRRLPITALFQSPTVAALAELLQGQRQDGAMGSLVPIRATGPLPALFCVHADGSVFIYRGFASYLDARIPIFGLQAYGLSNPKHPPYRHVDEMASHYIREMRAVQPRGPYHLCAFSAGGLIIFEMARQLEAAGEKTAFLGLLDAYGPGYPEPLTVKSRAQYKASVHLNTLRIHGLRGQAKYLWGRARHRIRATSSKLCAGLLLKLQLPLPGRIRYEYVAGLIDRAAEAYPHGRTYAGDATLFRAATQPSGIVPDPTLGWGQRIAGELKIVNVTGTHNSIMMHEPHVAALIRTLDSHLTRLHSLSTPENH